MAKSDKATGVRTRTRIVVGIVLALVVMLGLWGFWLEPRRLVLHEVQLAIPGWVSERPLRIAVLSDLHVGSPHNGLRRLAIIVERTNAAGPDLIAIAGDLVIQGVWGGRFVPPESIARELRRLSAPLGVFAVLGNHDWWLDAARVGHALRHAGIVVLEDSAVAIPRPNGSFWLGGVSDFWEGKHDVEAVLHQVDDSSPVILFTHNPDVFPTVPARVSLTIAGHTHGGQVKVPWLGRPVVPSKYGQRYAAGHIVEGGRHLFVGTGIGTSLLPVRFRVPPQLLVLKVTRPVRKGS